MKNFLNVIKVICILFLVSVLLIFLMIKISDVQTWYKQNRSYDMIYATQADKKLAQVIENSIYMVSNSKSLDTFMEEYKKPSIKDLKNYYLDITLTDITHVCYSKSVYGTPAPEMLDDIGIKNKYAYLIEDKKQVGYGEGSSLFMFVKANGDVIPIFVSDYFYELRTEIGFPELGYTTGCAKLDRNELNIKINSSLQSNSLLILK